MITIGWMEVTYVIILLNIILVKGTVIIKQINLFITLRLLKIKKLGNVIIGLFIARAVRLAEEIEPF